MLLNLVINARDAMSGGGLLSIYVTRDQAGSIVRLSVSDTETGLDIAIAQWVFEPFSTKAPGQGAGLGLTICAEIIKTHQGTLQIERAEIAGCLPRIWLAFAGNHMEHMPVFRPAHRLPILLLFAHYQFFKRFEQRLHV